MLGCDSAGLSNCGSVAGGNLSVITNSYFSSDATCVNNGAGGTCNSVGSSGSHLGGYFYNVANAPLSSWDFNSYWTDQTTNYPTLNPVVFNEQDWGNCNNHVASGNAFAGGKGTMDNPYLICTKAEFLEIGTNTAYWSHQHYKLMNDIDMTGTSGTDFIILGNSVNVFSGTFDGNNKKISNFNYVNGAQDDVGLFGRNRPPLS